MDNSVCCIDFIFGGVFYGTPGRDYKNFDGDKFRSDLKAKIIEADCITVDTFISILNYLLDMHAPRKQKTIRGNSAPFMNKTLSKAFMTRARLRNKYNKTRSDDDRIAYKNLKTTALAFLLKKKRNITEISM